MDVQPSGSSAIYSVFHPTDFSPASMLAFAHALKIALSIQGKLDILHVDTQDQARVLRQTHCPLLIIPVGSRLA